MESVWTSSLGPRTLLMTPSGKGWFFAFPILAFPILAVGPLVALVPDVSARLCVPLPFLAVVALSQLFAVVALPQLFAVVALRDLVLLYSVVGSRGLWWERPKH